MAFKDQQRLSTACPLDCFDACGLIATVCDGRVTRVTGDERHPITRGFACVKAQALVQRANSPARLLHPLRKSPQGWRQISWESALDEIASRLASVREQSGTAAVFYNWDGASAGILKGLDKTFFGAYGGVTLPRGSLCWSAGLTAQEYDFGDWSAHEITDVVNSRCIVLWGHNPIDTKVHSAPFIVEARRRGAQVILIDPVRTRSASLATLTLQPKPGTDAVLAMAVAREIVRLGLDDKDFLAGKTTGWNEYRTRIEPWTLERAAEVTGLSIAEIQRFVEVYGTIHPAAIHIGYGIQRHRLGGATVRAIDSLAAITGNIGVPGGGASYGHAGWKSLCPVGGVEAAAAARRTVSRARLGVELQTLSDPPVEMAIITRSNPVCQSPDTNSVVRALQRIPFKVVIEHFMTDTAALADIVLPATNSFEEDDLYCASWHHYLAFGPSIVEPPGECRPEYSIWCELADRLGLDAPRRVAPREYLASVIEPLKTFGVTLERLETEGALRNPLASEVPYADWRFPTPSGRYELYSQSASERGHDPLPGVEFVPGGRYGVSVDDKYPLALLSPQPRHRMHSQFDNLGEGPVALTDRPLARIHSETAALAGVSDGDEVEVSSRQGRVTTTARIDATVRPGVVVIPDGNWLSLGGGVNYLTPALETDMGEQAAYYECACAIRKVR